MILELSLELIAIMYHSFNIEQALLMKAAKVQMEDQKRLFREFFSRAFPRLFIDLQQFRAIMATVGWSFGEGEVGLIIRLIQLISV